MIITKEINIKINNKNILHFKNIGFDFIYGQIINISTEFLPKYSKYRIEVKCESCSNIVELSMQKYSKNKDRGGTYNCKSCNNITFRRSMNEKYGVDNPSKNQKSNDKRKITCLEKYGNEYIINSNYSKEKRIETCNKKYGVDHHMKNELIKYSVSKKSVDTKKENGIIIKDEELSKWNLYRRNVRKLTERNRKILFENWDGLDYYDNEYIKNNFVYKHTDILFPSIDHKISIIYGFLNNISAEEISNLKNLCITKKKNNSSKGHLTEEEFKKKCPTN